MGYGLVELIHSGGRIGAAEQVLLFRGLLSPGGHGAWTGLVSAALWGTAVRSGRGRAWIALIQAFTAAVVLHALRDTTDSITVGLLVAIVGATLLAAQIRRVAPRDGDDRRLDHPGAVTAYPPARAPGRPRR